VARAEALQNGGARVLTFGGTGGETPGIPDQPEGLETRLAPVLERAVELGAREVTVVSDLRLVDPENTARAVRALGVELTVEATGQPLLNAGIATFELPPFAARTDTLTAQIAVFGERPGVDGAPQESPGDSVTL